ncbi:MAG: class I SAM-dependent methyltransferase [Anaerolineales bacterium]|jgi:2-polyprenyl-3-methyl-5-hydroxy-6-metoxy-1,4-benzoquinol methylase|nr:class I SAM-dependent methyltransferase [Anaerolineales bacterium]
MEIDPYPPGDFDAWASRYDQDVLDESCFPFIGYQQVLQMVVRLSAPQAGMRVLDLGTGTGNLAGAFASLGCEVWATDFAPKMLALAKVKHPEAHFVESDFRQGWPADVEGVFDRIVSAYVFHHVPLADKVRLSAVFAARLAPQGKLVLADLAFPNAAGLEAMRRLAGAAWDEEYYWLADETLAAYQQAGMVARYTPVSICAGVFEVMPA